MSCVFGTFWNHFKFEKKKGAFEERKAILRKLGHGYRSAKSIVERTAGDTTGRERCEDKASVQGTSGRTSARTVRPEQKPREVSLNLWYCNPE